MLYSDLKRQLETADGGMASKKFFTGCRVTWRDDKGRHHFGVVINTGGDLLNCIDDVGAIHAELNFLHVEKYEDWETHKDTGRLKALTDKQKKSIEAAKRAPTDPKKYFTRKVMIKWGRPLLRAIFLYSNRTFFANKLLIRSRLCPPMDKKKQASGAMAVYYTKTRKMVVNPEYATTVEQVFICLVHEMIHMYDHLVRKKLGRGEDPHGPWFKAYAQKIEKYIGVANIYSVQDNWNDTDPNLRMAGEFDVDTEEDDLGEKSSKPYWMVLMFFQNTVKGRTQNTLKAMRVATEDKAYTSIEKLENAGYKYRFFLYKMDLAYFERLMPTGSFKPSNVNKLSRVMSPQQAQIIKKHGEPDNMYGDLFKWLDKRGLKIDNNTELMTAPKAEDAEDNGDDE